MARNLSPAALAALNLFGFGALGYLALGQRQKAMWFALGTVVLALFCVGALLPVLAAVDVYRLGQRQRAGRVVGEDESAIEWIDAVLK
ncbi:MAG: hypothetical protein RIT28_888 [Pseudomonadota bacterium]